MKTLLLAFILFASPACVFAQSQVPKPKPGLPQPNPPAEKFRSEWLEFTTGSVVDIEFEPFHGALTFSIKEERYHGIRFFIHFTSEHEAERASGSAAVLAELRHAEKIKLEVAISADGKVSPSLRSLVLCYSRLGPAAPRKIN